MKPLRVHETVLPLWIFTHPYPCSWGKKKKQKTLLCFICKMSQEIVQKKLLKGLWKWLSWVLPKIILEYIKGSTSWKYFFKMLSNLMVLLLQVSCRVLPLFSASNAVVLTHEGAAPGSSLCCSAFCIRALSCSWWPGSTLCDKGMQHKHLAL